MSLSPEQLDNWFTYHAPTEETAPRYAAIRATEAEAVNACLAAVTDPEGGPLSKRFALVNQATRCFAEVIDSNAPDCADKAAAIRCVRLMRNAANEAIAIANANANGAEEDGDTARALLIVAMAEATKARWQANSAIACGGR